MRSERNSLIRCAHKRVNEEIWFNFANIEKKKTIYTNKKVVVTQISEIRKKEIKIMYVFDADIQIYTK